MNHSSKLLLGILFGFSMLTFAGRRRCARRRPVCRAEQKKQLTASQVRDLYDGKWLNLKALQAAYDIIKRDPRHSVTLQMIEKRLKELRSQQAAAQRRAQEQQARAQAAQEKAPPPQIQVVPPDDISAAAACAPEIDTGAESRRVSGVGYVPMEEIMGQRQRLRASTVQNDGPSKNVNEPEFMKARRSLRSCKRLGPSPESQSQSPESLPVVEQLDLGTTPANVLQSSSRSALLSAVHQRTRARSCEPPSRPKGPPCPPPDAPQANSSTSRLVLCTAIEQGVQLKKVGATGGRHQRSKSQLAVALESVRDQIAPQDEDSDNDVEEEEWQED